MHLKNGVDNIADWTHPQPASHIHQGWLKTEASLEA